MLERIHVVLVPAGFLEREVFLVERKWDQKVDQKVGQLSVLEAEEWVAEMELSVLRGSEGFVHGRGHQCRRIYL